MGDKGNHRPGKHKPGGNRNQNTGGHDGKHAGGGCLMAIPQVAMIVVKLAFHKVMGRKS